MRATRSRLDEVIKETRPDILHAHSPVLNGMPALWAAERHGLPLVYEVRSLWEDAAVDWGAPGTAICATVQVGPWRLTCCAVPTPSSRSARGSKTRSWGAAFLPNA